MSAALPSADVATPSSPQDVGSVRRPGKASGAIGVVLACLGSMRLSVVLILLLTLLTWLGTMAQIEGGLWKAQRDYFESWGLIAELPLSFWGEPWLDAGGKQRVLAIPLPGAYPVMALLFLNLLVGGLARLRWQVRNCGVLITHIGIGLLLIAGFVKLEFSFAGHLSLYEAPEEGGRDMQRVHESSTFISFHDYELVLMRSTTDGSVEERVVPESALAGARSGIVVVDVPGLPFQVQVHDWLDNCQPRQKGPMVNAPTPVVTDPADGTQVFLQPVKVAREREGNTAGCYVTVMAEGGARFEGVLYGFEARPMTDYRWPFTFEVGGVRYGLDLRRVYLELPFAVRLDEFQKNDHPGTSMARDFRSFVTVKEGAAERKVQIFMNNPLRKDGYTLYQTNWGPQQGGGPPWYSVFEVSWNPSDMWPAIACLVIFLGLLIHFVQKLVRFLLSDSRQSLKG